jgi:transmembrane sensor
MTNVKDPLGQDALLAEASRWFAALDAGTARPDEFEAWRSRNPAHAVAYARIVANWESMASMPLPQATPSPDIVPARTSRRQWLKAAAVGLPVAMLGSGFLAERAYAWNGASTGVGETKRVPLPDGSIAYLNTDSALSWRFGRDSRTLRLDRGEVALDIRRGAAALLRANEAALPLSPGLFDARITAGRAELTMVDGAAVPLPGAAHAMTLRPNDAVIIAGDRSLRLETRSSEQVASLMAWRAGEIIFLDQSVADAVTDFNRHLTRKISVADAELGREKIGGRFDIDRPDQFLRAVSLSLKARVIDTPDGYELTR